MQQQPLRRFPSTAESPVAGRTLRASIDCPDEDRFRLRRGVPVVRDRAATRSRRALARLGGEVRAELHFQPFELNPQMPPEGEDIVEHLARKYGITPEQVARNSEAIRQRGAAVGFTFGKGKRKRICNTFDAHRLLHWAGLEGRQRELKHALLRAYFTDGEIPAPMTCWCERRPEVGLDAERARSIVWLPTSTPTKCASASASTSTTASTRCRRSSSTTAI